MGRIPFLFTKNIGGEGWKLTPSCNVEDILGKTMQGVRGWTEYHQISYRDVKLELVCYESSASTTAATTTTVPE
jgi:hypothetical protein